MGRAAISLLLIFAGVSWILLLAGVASTQSGCVEYGYSAASTAGYFGPGPCHRMFALTWWVVWYEFFTLVGITAAMATAFFRWRLVILGAMGPLTTLMMLTADSFLYFVNLNVSDHSRPNSVVAGAILLCIANLLLIAAMALLDETEVAGPPPVVRQKQTAPSPPPGEL